MMNRKSVNEKIADLEKKGIHIAPKYIQSDLRHTFASLMLLKGVSVKIVSEALGHSSVAFTMDVYQHILENMQGDAMVLLDEIIPAGRNKVSPKNNANLTPKIEITVAKT